MYEILIISFIITFLINIFIYLFFWRKKIKSLEKTFTVYLQDLDELNIKLKRKIDKLEQKLANYEQKTEKKNKK